MGGWFVSFYVDKSFEFLGVILFWGEFFSVCFVINGVEYCDMFGVLFDVVYLCFVFVCLVDNGGVIVYGDVYNVNVWFEWYVDGVLFFFFDLVFVGEYVLILLVEIKMMFYNIFVYLFWFYDLVFVE